MRNHSNENEFVVYMYVIKLLKIIKTVRFRLMSSPGYEFDLHENELVSKTHVRMKGHTCTTTETRFEIEVK